MNRPQPKELVVRRWAENIPFLFITVSSEDARRWIEQEGPTLGRLSPPLKTRSYYMLEVMETYDVNEVMIYLQSYNAED